MQRRDFIKNTTAAISSFYILPSGRLFAPTGTRIANHVVFCLFAGGIRNLESVHKAEGNLMPNLLKGSESISSDIATAMESLTPLAGATLQEQGTLFKELRYAEGIAGHFQGHMSALTGHYIGGNVNFSRHTPFPSVFEYYRKHNAPNTASTNAWWISNGTGENENLCWSEDVQYGTQYAANFLCGPSIAYNSFPIFNCKSFSGAQRDKIEGVTNFLNQNFKKPSQSQPPKFQNQGSSNDLVKEFYQKIAQKAQNGGFDDVWGLGTVMNYDMFNVALAEEVITQFKPELLVVNMTETDVCHDNFTAYCNNMRKADYAAKHLWQTIQNTPGMKDDTIMIIMPEHGRNESPNSIVDDFGRYSFDHGDDQMSKEIFCMVVGPQGKVVQNQVFSNQLGQSIDVVPTIAHVLGFKDAIPSGYLSGRALEEAFV
jgi:hypothetical protein